MTTCLGKNCSFASAFRKLLSVYVFSYFPVGFEGRMWDLIVSVPDHCLSFYSALNSVFRFGVLYSPPSSEFSSESKFPIQRYVFVLQL